MLSGGKGLERELSKKKGNKIQLLMVLLLYLFILEICSALIECVFMTELMNRVGKEGNTRHP